MGSLMTEFTLAVAATVIAATLAGVYFTSLNQVTDLQKLQVLGLKEQLYYRCDIIFAHSSEGSTTIKFWVKNIGFKDLPKELIKKSELVILNRNKVYYLLYGESSNSWNYRLLNDSDDDGRWDPSETIEVEAHLSESLTSGDYYLKFVLFNGAESEYNLSV
ncbi:MAG: hypothetical protein DRN68_06535 [Thaumarchaeota archaeon]|nr:MAG: hypothetical protein DRN68_06535 [Nitrososphaerota archaeon]